MFQISAAWTEQTYEQNLKGKGKLKTHTLLPCKVVQEKKKFQYLLHHLMLHVFFGGSFTREGDNQLRKCTIFNKVTELIFINVILQALDEKHLS